MLRLLAQVEDSELIHEASHVGSLTASSPLGCRRSGDEAVPTPIMPRTGGRLVSDG